MLVPKMYQNLINRFENNNFCDRTDLTNIFIR